MTKARGAPATRDLSKYMDGHEWEFTAQDMAGVRPAVFRTRLQQWANNRGYRTRTRVTEDKVFFLVVGRRPGYESREPAGA